MSSLDIYHLTWDSEFVRSAPAGSGGEYFWIAPDGEWMLTPQGHIYILSNTNSTADMTLLSTLTGSFMQLMSASIVAGPSLSQPWLVAIIQYNTPTVQIFAVNGPSSQLLDTITLPPIVQLGVSIPSFGQFVLIQPDKMHGAYWITAIFGSSPQSGIYRYRWVV
jgi:hypothetical protein